MLVWISDTNTEFVTYRLLTALKVGKCGDGEGWRRVGRIALKMKDYYKESRIKGYNKIKGQKAKRIGHILRSKGKEKGKMEVKRR